MNQVKQATARKPLPDQKFYYTCASFQVINHSKSVIIYSTANGKQMSLYLRHHEQKVINIADMQHKKIRHNLNKKATHLYFIDLHLGKYLNQLINPKLDDAWLDDSDEVALLKEQNWKRRQQ